MVKPINPWPEPPPMPGPSGCAFNDMVNHARELLKETSAAAQTWNPSISEDTTTFGLAPSMPARPPLRDERTPVLPFALTMRTEPSLVVATWRRVWRWLAAKFARSAPALDRWDPTDDPVLREAQAEVDALLGVGHKPAPLSMSGVLRMHRIMRPLEETALRLSKDEHARRCPRRQPPNRGSLLTRWCYLDDAESRARTCVFWHRFECGLEVEITIAQAQAYDGHHGRV